MSGKFKQEFRKQLRLAIAAAIGFTIAFSWRDFIGELIKSWTADFFNITNIHSLNLISALLITIIGVILILISSKILE